MDATRSRIAIGMAAGVVWGVGLLALGRGWSPEIAAPRALALAFLPGGLVLLALIGRLAALRFHDDRLIDGQPFAPGSPGAVAQSVLTNTVEQMVLALAIWPVLFVLLGPAGPGVVLALGLGFGVTRLAFWAGYRAAPPLRAFGFAGGFYPTVLAAIWCLILLLA